MTVLELNVPELSFLYSPSYLRVVDLQVCTWLIHILHESMSPAFARQALKAVHNNSPFMENHSSVVVP